jgi:hypothetical protein
VGSPLVRPVLLFKPPTNGHHLARIPVAVYLGALFLVPAAVACRILLQHAEVTARVISAQAMTLLSFVLYSLGSGIGLLLAR